MRPDSAARFSFKTRAGLALLVCAAGFLSVAFFFRYDISNGFTILFGDRFDGVIELSVLEHWFSTFRGLAHWSETGYFYPLKLTLGYDIGWFLYGAIYSVFRVAGFDPYLSGECVNIVLRLIAYFGFYWAARRMLNLSPGLAIFGAVLFTISNNMFVGTNHAQLLSLGFAPVLIVLLDGMATALLAGRRIALLLWGISAALLYAGWLLTDFYMAWYCCLFGSFMLVAYVALAGRAELRTWWRALRRHAVPVAIVLVVLFAANLPFLSVYLPAARESGMFPWHEARGYTLSLPDLFFVGDGSLLYGRIVSFMNHALGRSMPPWSARLTGFPPGLLWLFGWGVIAVLVTRQTLVPRRPVFVRALVIATLATWVLTFHLDNYSLWWFIYEAFPGAKAARVVARYQVFLAAPVIAIAVLYLSASARKIIAPVLVLVCGLLLVEQANTTPFARLDRPHELARLAAVPPAPPSCMAFFVSKARPERLADPASQGFYSHNVDAMIIAELRHLPTINGAASVQPDGGPLNFPDRPDYLDRVRHYALANHVTHLCSLDLTAMKWRHFPLKAGPQSVRAAPQRRPSSEPLTK